MGLHLSFGIGPIRYTTSSRRRRQPTKAQVEANRAANQAALMVLVWLVLMVLVWLVLMVLLVASAVTWMAVLLVAWLVWVPVAFLASIRLDVTYLRRHVLLMLFVPFASLAAVRLNGFLGRHWRQPMQLHPFHSKEKPAVTNVK
jgi:hypothetical protein